MKVFAFIAILLPVVASTQLKHDPHYSLANNSPLSTYACSNGANGLITKTGAQNVGQLRTKLPSGVYLMAAPTVTGWNSVNCGQCWQLRNPKNNKTISTIAVDHASPDLVGGDDAFKALSPSATLKEGIITVFVTQKAHSTCFK